MPELCECRICGAKSAWTQGFVKAWSPLRGSRTVCVTCSLYGRKYRGVYGRWLLSAALLALAGYYVTESAASAALFAFELYAIAYLAVVVHEVGHAVTSRALGMSIIAFSIGGGLHVKVISWRNTFLLLGPSPVEGLVVVQPASTRHYRKKMALVFAAGATFNLLCALLGLSWLESAAFTADTTAARLVFLWTAVNFLLVLNLLPVVSQGSFGQLRSDGLQLLDLLRISDADIEQRLSDARFAEAMLAFHYGALGRARALVERMIESGELPGRARALATAVLISSGKTQEGIDLARRYLDAGDGPVEERAILMNNLAWALVDPVHGQPTPAKIAEADELSARAMEVLSMANAVRGTRGAVLLAKGAHREAVELLIDKRFRLEPPWTRATVKATLALAQAGAGAHELAAATLEEAAKLDPHSAHVKRAAQRVALPREESLSYDTPTQH